MEKKSEFLALPEMYSVDHSLMQTFYSSIPKSNDQKETAVSIYYEVRNRVRYNPFLVRFDPEELFAYQILERGEGHCIDKALLFIAFCRMAGIPSRLGLAKVQNHMGTRNLEEILGTSVLVPHGYAECFIEDKWVKCTPAFNLELCQKLGVPALDFDGENDSVFQAFDRAKDGFMEYIEDYGAFAEPPIGFMLEKMIEQYPHLFNEQGQLKGKLTG